MIVICEECGKKYRIDPSKIKREKASFDCKACRHRITVSKPLQNEKLAVPTPPEATPVPESVPEKIKKPTVPKTKREEKTATETAPSKNRFGLTEKIISLMLLVTLIPLFVFWGITFKQTNDRIRNDSEKLLLQSSKNLADRIDEWMNGNLKIFTLASNLPAVISMNRLDQEPILKVIQKENPWIREVLTLDRAGKVIAASSDTPMQAVSNLKIYKDVLGGRNAGWQTLAGTASNRPVLLIGVPIKPNGKAEPVGVLAGAMDTDEISKQVMNRQPGRAGEVFLTDEAGRVVAHPLPQYVVEGKNLSNHPLIAAFKQKREGLISFEDDKGTPFLGHARGIRSGWILGLQAEQKEVFQVLKKAQFFACIFLGVTMIIVVLIAFIAGRTMTGPIKKLTDAADRISVGELDVEIDINRKDEIGDLAESVLRMQDSLRLSIERLRRRR